MNEYAQDLKTKLEQVDQYVIHADIPRATNIFPDTTSSSVKSSVFTAKNIFWFLGVVLISISVVAFLTQTVLLVVDNVSHGSKNTSVKSLTLTSSAVSTTTDQQQVDDILKSVYVRADLDRNPFGVSTSTTEATSTTAHMDGGIPPMIGVSIPGVTRIGYNDAVGEEALSNNINKYDSSTFVIGGREGELGSQDSTTIGGGDDPSTQSRYSVLPKSIEPILSSKAYLVGDLETGEVILEKNADTVYPLASVSKLMTAVVAREKMDLQQIAIVSRDASGAYGSQGELVLGEKIRLRDLQFPLLMESSNDAAEVFADQYGHAKFIEEMNKKAASLDMTDTYYGDPSGLDPQNTSTPHNMFTLARYIMQHDPEIFDMTRVKQFSIKGHTWYNRNAQLPLAGFVGGKNGYIDQAKQTTVSLFDVPLAKGGVRTVVIVILKSDAKNADVNKLIAYLKKSVTYQVE